MEAYAVMSNTTTVIQCTATNYAHISTTRLVTELQSSCKRSADMLVNNVVRACISIFVCSSILILVTSGFVGLCNQICE